MGVVSSLVKIMHKFTPTGQEQLIRILKENKQIISKTTVASLPELLSKTKGVSKLDAELLNKSDSIVSILSKEFEFSKSIKNSPLLEMLRDKKIICRQVKDTVIAGESFANKSIEDLKLLKDNGIKTIIDFREFDPLYKAKCESLGLEYISSPLIHISDLSKQKIFGGFLNREVSSEFVTNLKKFLDTTKKGNVYMGCQYGIDRTNFGLVLDYLFNFGSKSKIPKILPSDIGSRRTLLNRNLDLVRKIVKRLSPEQRQYLEIPENFETILNERIRDIVMENKSLPSKKITDLISIKLDR